MWGRPFEDEISNKLQHHGRGILSMANSGKDTNGSQLYLILPCIWDNSIALLLSDLQLI
jgi:cyclophilin family peptidyl-prolyl cis-trans isomerase